MLWLVFVLLALSACHSTNTLVRYDYQNHPVNLLTDSITDEAYERILQPYKNKMSDELSEVISFSDTSLIAYRPESPLSNFISDLILKYGRNYAIENGLRLKVSFSLVNNGGLRTSLPAGKITVRDIYELTPFENEPVLLRLKGEQVKELADHITIRGGEGVGGIAFGMDGDIAVNIQIDNHPLAEDSVYWMITNDYIANGGDGMKVLTGALERIDTGAKVRDLLIDELKKMKMKGETVSAKTDGRIYRVN